MQNRCADAEASPARDAGVRSALAVARRALKKRAPTIGRVALAAAAAASVLGTMSCIPTWGPPAPPHADTEGSAS
ncbi:MAG: hypothetical protein KC503_23670 [Myxococcales bacterium]|nr:hypothetical protein [Myxococcales bacterium]